MAETTIEWTATRLPDGTVLPGYSFNPWVGCTKVSPACDHCYAESWAKRTGNADLWAGERRRTTPDNWRKPLKWNREAEASGTRRKVFCASLADVFDNQVPEDWRIGLWTMIAQTPHLDWLLLTKRPQNIAKMLPGSAVEQTLDRDVPWGNGWRNVWLGTTAENQQEADRRIPHLLAVPAAVRFLSCEPLLDQVMLHELKVGPDMVLDCLRGDSWRWGAEGVRYDIKKGNRIHWVIAGGESGPGARPPMLKWLRFLRNQCQNAGVPFFFKQFGEFMPEDPAADHTANIRVGKKKAGALLDGREWREFPEAV